ncbi:MAG: glycosyltransferase, partial [Pseudomonadota bacterium]
PDPAPFIVRTMLPCLVFPMKFFIVTRFAIGLYDNEILKNKIDFWQTITFRNLTHQSDQSFIWLILIDTNMPANCRRRMEAITAKHNNIHLIPYTPLQEVLMVQGGQDQYSHALLRYALQQGLIDNIGEFVITANIDDDDCWDIELLEYVRKTIEGSLHKDTEFAKRADDYVQQNIRTKSSSFGLVLSYRIGAFLYPVDHAIVAVDYKSHSMANFVCARFVTGLTPLSISHESWPDFAKFLAFTFQETTQDMPAWLYTRHAYCWDGCTREFATKGQSVTPQDHYSTQDRWLLENRFMIDIDALEELAKSHKALWESYTQENATNYVSQTIEAYGCEHAATCYNGGLAYIERYPKEVASILGGDAMLQERRVVLGKRLEDLRNYHQAQTKTISAARYR